ncbi:SusC/RagA family TonB-linked outer membrane protein [Zunongwangia sp. HGR-M22]|uniref:SusC/RagA family TonB-linked outer membrane protein n=1 Tax=Zunongwangia sp. HGR-M22 TaxID=3015168 RepID=UPI0022DD9594|nr:TonB-dependent receptor [Zunongwangia sp. HGR-M22]WBL24696.1 TonB-dependent receptor [Zunongwangia sp. HGR-M22]
MKKTIVKAILGISFFFINLFVHAQSKQVEGTVKDENNIPLPGVNIRIKGTNAGTQSDFDGNFSIEANDGQILIFSFVGTKTIEKLVEENQNYDVVMASDQASLEEVVIVGYGKKNKRNITGSVSSVETEQIESQPNTNVAQALRGRVAGVQFNDNGRPGQGGSILIRGQASLTAGNDPLIIVDGAFFYGELADINPNDIESMQVLKDASATAIYGSRASNGVILISTKTGVQGKPTIRLNVYSGISDYYDKVPLYGPEAYLQRRRDFNIQNANEGETPITDVERILDTETELEQYNAGKTIDPWEFIAQDAIQQSYNLSISGRMDNTSYYLSGNLVKEEGLIYGDQSERISIRMNLENNITDWLKIGLNSSYTQRDLSGIPASLSSTYWLSPYAKVYDDNGDLLPYPTNDQLVTNPLFDASQRKNEEVSNNLFANIFAEINFPFLDGLSYSFNYNPNIQWDRDYTFIPIYIKNGINNTGAAGKTNENEFNWQIEHILKYAKNWGEHALDLTLLYGNNSSFYETTTAESSNFFTDVNGWNNLNIGEVQNSYSYAEDRTGTSEMGRLNYQYLDRYLVTLTIRRDGSSVFGTNNKYGIFPSMALGWIASEENFLNHVNEIDLLKFRLSFGQVGNQSIDPYSSLDRSAFDQYVFGDGSQTYTGSFPLSGNMPNPNLKWETSTSFNAAVDFTILDRRIDGTVEYYDTKTIDLLTARSIPVINGFSSVLTNIGELNNKGLEVSLSTINIDYPNSQFRWSSSIIFSTNKNKIVRLYGNDNNRDGIEDDDVSNRWFIGQPINSNFDYVFDGIYQEGDDIPEGYMPGWVKVKDINNDGSITPEDRTIISQGQPKYRLGLGNNFEYKNFSFSFFVNSAQGWEAPLNILDPSGYSGNSFPGRSVNMVNAGYWTPENQSNTRPSLNWTNPLGMSFYQSKDFIWLQDATLAYKFDSDFVNSLNMKNLKIYLSGRNLLIFTDWMGPDPESGYNNINNLYPSARTIVGGLDLSF